MQPQYYEIQPRSGSHYLLENGEPIARFETSLKKPKRLARCMSPSLPRCTNATPSASCPRRAEKEAVIKAYDTLVKSPEDRKKLEKHLCRCWLPPATALWLRKKEPDPTRASGTKRP